MPHDRFALLPQNQIPTRPLQKLPLKFHILQIRPPPYRPRSISSNRLRRILLIHEIPQ
jgi:hypothetical protein